MLYTGKSDRMGGEVENIRATYAVMYKTSRPVRPAVINCAKLWTSAGGVIYVLRPQNIRYPESEFILV